MDEPEPEEGLDGEGGGQKVTQRAARKAAAACLARQRLMPARAETPCRGYSIIHPVAT